MFKRFIKSVGRDVTSYYSMSITSVRCLLVGLSVIFSAVNKLLSKLVVLGVAPEFDGLEVEEGYVEEIGIDAGFVEVLDIVSATFALCTIMAMYFSMSPDPQFPTIFFDKASEDGAFNNLFNSNRVKLVL